MKVLVVDDNEFNRQLLAMILEDHHFDSCFACNGQEAVECFESDMDIDLILMDVNMPVMDGLEATEKIKANAPHRYAPIVFVTALDDQETLAHCLTIGGDDFIPKPINEEVLVAKLKAHQRSISYHRQLQASNEELAYHRRLMDREHNIIENIFKRCMGKNQLTYTNINHYISPMSQFNGDIVLITPSPLGGVYILLGDFTGHGLAAAIGCLPVSDVFFAMTRKKSGVGDIAREINSKLQELLPDNMFFCASILELDQSGDRLTIWSGGMNDILLLDKHNKISGKVQAQHMPLGILDAHEFDGRTDMVTPFKGLRAYLYTDGVIEANSGDGELFGEQRLETVLRSGSNDNIGAIKSVLEKYVQNGSQSDDIAIVEIIGEPLQSIIQDYSQTEEKEPGSTVLPWKIQLPLTVAELRNPTVMQQIMQLIKAIEGADQHGDLLFTLISELYSNALEHGVLKLDSSIKCQPDGFEQYYSLRQQRLENLVNGDIQLEFEVNPGQGDADGEPTASKLRLRLTDSGSGFDYHKTKQQLEDDSLAFARGMNLVESLCEQFQYSNNGKTVTVVYPLQN